MNTLRQTIAKHNYQISAFLAVMLFALLGFNGYLFYAQITEANPHSPADPLSTLPTGDSLPYQLSSGGSNLPLIVAGVSTLLFAVVLFLFYLTIDRRARNRDQRRITDLQLIKDGLEQYKNEYGHYPISPEHQASLTNGILMTTQWEAHGLPENSVMASYVPNWPLTDPHIAANEPEQDGNYVYRSVLSGQAYELLASLERPGSMAVEADSLPEHLLLYNYRLRSEPVDPEQKPQAAVESAPVSSFAAAEDSTEAPAETEAAASITGTLDYSQFTLPSKDGGDADSMEAPTATPPPAPPASPAQSYESSGLPDPISGPLAPPPATIEAPEVPEEISPPPPGSRYKPLSITPSPSSAPSPLGGQVIAHAVTLDEERIIEQTAEEAVGVSGEDGEDGGRMVEGVPELFPGGGE